VCGPVASCGKCDGDGTDPFRSLWRSPAKPRAEATAPKRVGCHCRPDEAVSLKAAETDGSDLILTLRVKPLAFDPGKNGGLIVARAPYLRANRTPVTVSRSENESWQPLGIGLLGAIAGFGWYAALKFLARNKLNVAWWWLIVAGTLAVVAGEYAALKSYWGEDAWAFDDNALAILGAGFTGASTGSIIAAIGAIWLAPVKPAPASAPPNPGLPTPSPTDA
jgi:hypothetical protein